MTIRAKGKTGIQDWLVANGFAVPEYMAPVIDSYTTAVRSPRRARAVLQDADGALIGSTMVALRIANASKRRRRRP